MRDQISQASQLLRQFKGDSYVFGVDCFDKLGPLAAGMGKRAAVIAGGAGKGWGEAVRGRAMAELRAAGVEVVGSVIDGARPNSPREDVVRIAEAIGRARPEFIIAIGGGSVIDAAKAAAALATLEASHATLDQFFGTGQVSRLLANTRKKLPPMLAVQLASASAAHLTKYANVTDLAAAQKKLIVDDALTPARALFDYSATDSMPPDFTADGAMDGLAHCLEVFLGAKPPALDRIAPAALLGIELILSHVRSAVADGGDLSARQALGLGTDLGGYCIMLGGTSGGHLTSFSLVDVLSHGRACAIMNPYYTAFFAPAVGPQLEQLAEMLARLGIIRPPTHPSPQELGRAVAEGLLAVNRSLGIPTRLADVHGCTAEHMRRALSAARDPQLEMKLRNMPIPMSAGDVDRLMAPILQAAWSGDLSLVPKL